MISVGVLQEKKCRKDGTIASSPTRTTLGCAVLRDTLELHEKIYTKRACHDDTLHASNISDRSRYRKSRS